MLARIEEGLQSVQRQVTSEMPAEAALYISPQGKRTTLPDEEPFDLLEAVQRFLVFETPVREEKGEYKEPVKRGESRKVLLLLGDGGSGKSLFCQDLHLKLWQQYKPGQPIPLFISLPLLEDPVEHAIEESLSKLPLPLAGEGRGEGFTAEQIAELKKSQQFIFILDGYDELHQFKNLYVSNRLQEWNCKVIISCRTQYLYNVSDTDKFFMPFEGEKRQPWLMTQIYVAPFSEKQIEQYVSLSCHPEVARIKELRDVSADSGTQEEKEKKSERNTYQQLISIPGLKQLIATPFMLHIALEALPDIQEKYVGWAKERSDVPTETKEHKSKEEVHMTQAALYDAFVERWFTRQQAKLEASGHTKEDLKPKFWTFCKSLALEMRERNTTYVVHGRQTKSLFAPKSAEADPWEKFFGTDAQVELLRSACPIRKFGKDIFGFIHESMIEYFATRALYDNILESPPTSCHPERSEGSRFSDPVAQRSFAGAQDDRKDKNPICRSQYLTPRAIQLNADRIKDPQHGEKIKAKYFWYIDQSKTDEQYAIAAANAISALNFAKIPFSGMDFRKIKIPGANLLRAILDSTQLQGSDLGKVILEGAWLRQTNFTHAFMSGVRFGEWPYLQLPAKVNTFAYSKDGQWLAVGCSDHNVYLFDARTNKKIHVLKGHTKSVKTVAFDTKGGRLASGSHDKTIRIWEVASGKQLYTLEGHTSRVNSVAFDAKGGRLASGNHDKTIRVWDVTSGKQLYTLKGHTSTVETVAFDAKGECLASGSMDETIRVWDVASGKQLYTLKGHTEGVNSVTFDAKGELLASGSVDETIRVWELASGKQLYTLEGHAEGVTSVTFDANSERLASGSWDNTIRVWEVVSGKQLYTLEGHTGSINSVTFDAKGERLVSGSEDKTIRIWEVASGKQLYTSGGHTSYVTSVAFDAKGECLASGSHDKTIRVWEVASGKQLYTLKGHTDCVNSVAFDAKGERLASGCNDGTICVWEVVSGKQIYMLKGHMDSIYTVAFDAKGERLASGGGDKTTIHVWEVASGKQLYTLEGHKYQVSSVAFDAKGEHLASGSHDCTIRVWKIASGKQLHKLQGHTDQVHSVAFDAKSERLASGSWDKTIRIWEVADDKQLYTLEGHTSYVTSVAFDAKGERLISGSGDNTVRLWDLATGTCSLIISGFTGEVASVAWKEIGKDSFIATGCQDKAVRVFQVFEDESRLITSTKLASLLSAPNERDEKDKLRVVLRWTSYQAALTASEANIEGACLDEINFELLKQRGAIGTPAEVKQLPAPSDEKSPESESKSTLPKSTEEQFADAKAASQAVSGRGHDPRTFGTSAREAKSQEGIALQDVEVNAAERPHASQAEEPEKSASCSCVVL